MPKFLQYNQFFACYFAGFARYVEYLGTDFYDDTLDAKDRALIEQVHNVFEDDALESTDPLSVEVLNPEYEAFGSGMVYTKGCSLIKMMEGFLTLDVLNEGVTDYLEANQYDNAERNDLWNALDAVAHDAEIIPDDVTVAQIMEPWTNTPGYPVLTVSEFDGTAITYGQSRFFLNPDAQDDNGTWAVPITVYYPSDMSVQPAQGADWLLEQSGTLEITSTPYILNYKESGYYRVNYDMENWIALKDLMVSNPEKIDRLNRAQIYDDSFNLARAQKLDDYTIPLDISKAAALEDDYIPLYAALHSLQYLDRMIRQDTEFYPAMQTYIINLLRATYQDLGFDAHEGDSYPLVEKRNMVDEWMCNSGYEHCINSATSKFQEWMELENPDEMNPINPDQRQLIYKVAVAEGGENEFYFLLDRLPNAKSSGEVINILYGLAKTQNTTLLTELLDMTIDAESDIRSQDVIYVYRSAGATVVGRTTQFYWLVENYKAAKDYFQVLNMLTILVI